MPQLITVFGGTGFLGGAIARELARSGAAVRIASRHPYRPSWVEERHAVKLAAADVRDEASLARALDGAAAAVNAVSLYVESAKASFDEIHVQGAVCIGRVARAACVKRLVQVSGIGADPDSPSRYVRARARGEQSLRAVFPEAIIVRPSVIFGRGDALVSTLAGLSRLPVVPLFGRGDTRLQPVWVEDVAQGIARLLEGAGGERRLFELGGGQVYRYREIVELVLGHLGRRRLLLPLPSILWQVIATIMKLLSSPPLTRDQVLLMEKDNVVGDGVGTFAELGMVARSLEECLGEFL